MDRPVFISHSSRDKEAAAAICERFEAGGVDCWMAPRNLLAGQDYAPSIVKAIDASSLMLVVLSKDANSSDHVAREINRAVDGRVPILPVKVDDSALSSLLDYYLGKTHRFDASDAPLPEYLDALTSDVQRLLEGQPTTMPMPAAQDDQEQPVELEDLQIPPEEVAHPDEAIKAQLSYSVQVSRKKPACLIMVVDQSFSMTYKIAGRDIKKKDAVADVVNNVLYSAVLTSTKEDGVRHYFDVGILSYGRDDRVRSAFNQDLVPIGWVADNPQGWVQKKWSELDMKGETVEREEDMPIWLEPDGKGKTLMRSAFERALSVVKDWTDEHKDSFPPIVLHITDGGYTKEDPAPVVRELQEQSTNVGSALVFNCHLSGKEEPTLMFPSAAVAEGFEGRTRQLHDMSSPLPEPMCEQARLLRYQVEVGARGYVRNADFASLIDFMDIGTKAVRDGVVEA